MRRNLLPIFNILLLRGAGSGTAVLLTLLVARVLAPTEAGHFLLLFNMTTIAAVCFRWGMDDVIIRGIAAADPSQLRTTAGHLMTMAHRRVGLWTAAALAGALVAATFGPHIGPELTLLDLVVVAVVSGLIALSACAGRVLQGTARINLATVVLNIAIPGLTVIGTVILLLTGVRTSAGSVVGFYAAAAIVVYISAVLLYPLGRPVRPSQLHVGRDAAADRAAANRLGAVVLSQQLLNWGALLIAPLAYAPSTYTAFTVNFKLASLVSLAMLAVNFTFASRLAVLHAQGELAALRKIVRAMLAVVTSTSVVAGSGLLLASPWLYEFSDVPSRFIVVLALLVGGQVMFAVSAVFALVLTMSHDERFLLVAQGICTIVGLALFLVLALSTPIEWATTAFLVAYGLLCPVLAWRVHRLLRPDI